MRTVAGFLLTLFTSIGFGQALEVTPIPFGGQPTEQPGMLSPAPVITDNLVVEIGFYIDAAKVEDRLSYRCDNYVASGHFLADRYPSDYVGGYYMATIGNGNLCWMDRPYYRPDAQWTTDVELTVTPFVCHNLKVTRTPARLTIELDGNEVYSTAPGWWAEHTWTYDGQNGLVGIGREKNVGPEALDTYSYSQFPGTISYYRENGVDLLAAGTLTGGAFYGDDPCNVPDTVSEACRADPNGAVCACENNPHPACNVCLIE